MSELSSFQKKKIAMNQYIPLVQFGPPIPAGHVQLNVLLLEIVQLPSFKHGLGSHKLGAEMAKRKYKKSKLMMNGLFKKEPYFFTSRNKFPVDQSH